MAICELFIQAQNAPCCIDELTIGTVSNLSAQVNVMFENLTTGRKVVLDGQTNGSGLLTVDISEHRFPVNHVFRISASLENTDYSNRLDITISTSTEEYVHVTFVKNLDSAGAPIADATYTLTI